MLGRLPRKGSDTSTSWQVSLSALWSGERKQRKKEVFYPYIKIMGSPSVGPLIDMSFRDLTTHTGAKMPYLERRRQRKQRKKEVFSIRVHIRNVSARLKKTPKMPCSSLPCAYKQQADSRCLFLLPVIYTIRPSCLQQAVALRHGGMGGLCFHVFAEECGRVRSPERPRWS